MTVTGAVAAPFGGLQRLNAMLDQAFRGFPLEAGDEGTMLTSAWLPPVDISEDSDALKIVMEVPGVRPEDVQISVESNLLRIRGEKRQEVDENADQMHRFERTYGVFERSFALPSTVDPERIEANYDAGLLSLRLPKSERAKPRQIEVKTSGGNVGSRSISSGTGGTGGTGGSSSTGGSAGSKSGSKRGTAG
jgi:HSP20 family protein